MIEITDKFSSLFKKYRLKAEISTLSEFGHLLAEKGFNYEDSIFSHWQNGSRVPQYRLVLLKVIEIFVEKGVIETVSQANELLSSANQSGLLESEINKIPLKLSNRIFQVPNRILNFTGRGEIINDIINNKKVEGKVIILHGPAGVGKTSLAIELGHLLQEKYRDGVLWYKVEEDNVRDILFSIAKLLGEDISGIIDLQVRATVVRSLLTARNLLLILDSAELYSDIQILIPNSRFCTTILTSQKSTLKIPTEYIDIKITAFTEEETLSLFKNVLKERFAKVGKSRLLMVARKVGNLPLAVHILARELLNTRNGLNNRDIDSNDLYSDIGGLTSAISLTYNKLDIETKSMLVSASIFKGKDFSLDSLAYINGLSRKGALEMIEKLINLSLVEYSTKTRFRIHPTIKEFVRRKLDYPRSSYLLLIALGIFTFFSSWWITDQYSPNFLQHLSIMNYSSTYFVMALYGGIIGMNTAIKWGGLKTLLGKAIFMFSSGLFMQVFGQLAYAYYIHILAIPIPYPSFGDIGYFGAIFLYIYGALLLAESSGIKINLELFRKKPIALTIPLVMLIIAYFLFLQGYVFDFRDPFKIILDFGYPLGEAIYLSIVILIFVLSRKILDGIMRSKALLLLIALALQFVADYLFIYDIGNYYSGNYIDFLYLLAYFYMTVALLSLRSIQIKVKNS